MNLYTFINISTGKPEKNIIKRVKTGGIIKPPAIGDRAYVNLPGDTSLFVEPSRFGLPQGLGKPFVFRFSGRNVYKCIQIYINIYKLSIANCCGPPPRPHGSGRRRPPGGGGGRKAGGRGGAAAARCRGPREGPQQFAVDYLCNFICIYI